jgi:hypothetical protein
MLANLLSILLSFLVIFGVIWLVETYFPRLTKLWKIMMMATIILAIIKLIHTWVCGWLCSPALI